MGFGGFSWKRALGLTKAKSRLSRSIGVPLTKGGRQRKFDAALGGGILGLAVGSTSRRSRSAAVRSDDHDDADAPVISPHEKELYGFPQSGAGFTCLMLAVMLLLPIVFFPIGILISIALLIVLLMHAHKKNGVSRENISFFLDHCIFSVRRVFCRSR